MGRFSNLEFDREEESPQQHEHEAPRDEKYYLGLAQDRFHEGRFEQALRFYSRALEFDTQLTGAWLGQVQALLELDEPHEARVWADKGLELFRNQPELLAAKGVASARLGELDKAMALSDSALAEKGSSAYRWRARGEVLLAREDRNEDFCFGKALAAAPMDWFEPLAVGRVYLYYRRYAPALRYLEIASSRNAASAYVWENLGRGLEGAGMAARARQAYRNALDLDPQRAVAREGTIRLDDARWFTGLWARVRSWFGR